jgi:hypothetical protein
MQNPNVICSASECITSCRRPCSKFEPDVRSSRNPQIVLWWLLMAFKASKTIENNAAESCEGQSSRREPQRKPTKTEGPCRVPGVFLLELSWGFHATSPRGNASCRKQRWQQVPSPHEATGPPITVDTMSWHHSCGSKTWFTSAYLGSKSGSTIRRTEAKDFIPWRCYRFTTHRMGSWKRLPRTLTNT